jgi:uncharacterized sulfatase
MPGTVPEGETSSALQSTVDLAPTFLRVAGIPVPRWMTGLDAMGCWTGEQTPHRSHVIVENRHNPTTMNLKTYIDDRYKLTVHFNQPYGELYDLQEDPGELRNLWDDPQAGQLKADLLLKFLHADMAIEPMPMPRIAGA